MSTSVSDAMLLGIIILHPFIGVLALDDNTTGGSSDVEGDAGPVPSDGLCYQQKRVLMNPLSPTDTIITVDDPKYMEEIACWEGHCKNLNMIKIGKELIHYLGISDKAPYRLLNAKRGYWGTTPATHEAGDTIYKLQVTLEYGYDGIVHKDARWADAFPKHIKKMLTDPNRDWHLEAGSEKGTWTLYQMENGQKIKSYPLRGRL